MGIRGELFSTRVLLENRTYFFNVKENRMGDLYLNIVESKNREGSAGFDRQSVILFAEDLQDFLKGFDESLRVMEKAVREKKKSGPPRVPRDGGREQSGDREYGGEGNGRGAYSRSDRGYGRQEQSGGRSYGRKEQSSGRDYGRQEQSGGRDRSRQDRDGSRDFGNQGYRDREQGARRAGRESSGSEEKTGDRRPRRVVARKTRQDD
jgi:hypothetical protein